jgi:ABC-type transporter lipoprotein component MlaA
MFKIKNKIVILLIIGIFLQLNVFAVEDKYPNYANLYLRPDKHENYNRKMFNFNIGLNKYCIKPIHIIWTSILPQFAMDRIYGVSHNIEFPIRLVSTLVQRDFQSSLNETKRFFVNTTIGLAGMFDPAKHLLNIYRQTDNMDKALSRCNVKSGAYFVFPVINFTTVRGLFGRVLDVALNPTSYIGTPILAIVKAGLTINRTSYIQSVINLVESSFADPYTVFKIAFGIDGYIKKNNYDRVNIIPLLKAPAANENIHNVNLTVSSKIINTENLDNNIKYDIKLNDYYAQSPLVDSMRTSLFLIPEVHKSMWNDLSLWNHSFAHSLKTGSVNIFDGRDDYNFKYILQKDKNAPLVILYPSTGDGIKASHPIMFAKMFYDQGFSVIIEGNPFQWEFVKSMEENYRPGLPSNDAKMMRLTTKKIIDSLQQKYNCKFENKVILGTSLAGLDVLFLAEQESKENTLGNINVISICPPIDLLYSVTQIDNYAQDFPKDVDEFRQKIAFMSSKIVKLYQEKDDIDFSIKQMPFTDEEAKFLTSFLMHIKLSDVMFTIENIPNNKKTDFYNYSNNVGFVDYIEKYIYPVANISNLDTDLGLISISDYLETSNNYKIYHTVNDYLISTEQLKLLKNMAKDKLTIFDNGSHMGFLYRKEFLENLNNTILNIKNSFI